MAIISQELSPQYDHTLSQATRNLEERLAEAEHMQAKQGRTICELQNCLQHWKQLYDASQEEIVKLKHDDS